MLCTASVCWLGVAVARADTPPTNDGAPPTIAGTAQDGDLLTADPGGWSGDAPITFSYAWSDGQTGQSIQLSDADVGQSLTVTVTASNDFGEASATSDSDGPVLAARPTPGDPPPVITGTAQEGQTLSVSNGTWSGNPTGFSYVWEDCDGSGNNCNAITGANSSTYTLQSSDVGSTIVASVTASNPSGTGSATTGAVGPVLPLAPTIGSTKPSITGVPQQGNTLSVSNGSWNNNPTGFAYVWEKCDSSGNNCNAITGANSSTYTLQSSDVGDKVLAQVTASNAGGQNSATSAGVGPVLPLAPTIGSTKPSLAGVPQQGNTLSVSNGSWNNNPTGFTYAWADCDGAGNNCAQIAGATSSSYTLKVTDVGGTIVAQVTALNAGGQNSATTGAVGPVLPLAPTIGSTKPGITGTPQQGNTLSVSNGTWNNNPTGFAYVWEDCNAFGTSCVPITGATSSTYTLQASDVGDKILAQVTASNAGGQNSVSTGSVGPVLPAAPTIGTAPGISGIAQQGRTLTVSNGTWGNNPTGFAYAWQDCDSSGSNCSSVGTNSSTYTVAAADVGKYVSVTVTASNAGGHTPVTTASVGPVLPPPPANTQLPVITKTGGTLGVSNGQWSNNPTGFSYTWESCNASGASCAAIPGATSNSYALSAADIGTTIVCVVTATGAGGSTSVSTAKTAIVGAADIPPASQPTTTGLLATPSAPVTNQSVTLIATVTAGTSSTALWGTVTFENAGAAIGGCANMPAVPSGRSATVACSTSFAASTAQLSAVFTPASGSILKNSSSPGTSLTVGPDTTSTTLDAASSVTVGASTTYTAAVAPGPHSGPVQPTGSVEFLDNGTPIGPCASQPLSGGGANCTVTYAVAGAHQITAYYSGDANFKSSSSPNGQVSAVAAPTPVLGTVTATMQWAFYFTPKYTLVRNLVVNGVAPGASVVVKCQGHGCPFTRHAAVLTNGKPCGRKAKRPCPPPGTLNLTSSFAGRHLAVGARITVSIIRPSWVGKSYTFTVRPRRGPRVQIGSLPVA
ncbi:MAG TPA: Ig-like domain repeat protein [Solirubrobacteraceae bacterium]|nr:Ig-like domain repeat protein [Solirubrobacteraceae bacterium]